MMPTTMRGKIITYSALILLITASATFYTGLASAGLTRSVEILFRNNIFMQEIRDGLDATETSLTIYLTTKSTESLKGYIRFSTKLADSTGKLNREIRNDESLLLQRNLSGILRNYLRAAEACVGAKRGRDIGGYTAGFETARNLALLARQIASISEKIFLADSLKAFSSFQSRISTVLLTNTVLLLAAHLTGFMLMVRYSFRLTDPLSKLAAAAVAIGNGEYAHELPAVSSSDEIGTTTAAFASMQKSIQNAFSELETKAELERTLLGERVRNLAMEHKLKDAELLALQTQINPHFLFNTLSAGMNLALTEDADKTADFLENLAAFIRYALKPPSRSVSVSEEIECAERYIWLMRLRFGDRYRFEIEADEEVSGVETPALVLQPLIENAFAHGLKNVESGGVIKLRSYRLGADAVLSVEDNGEGMSRAEMDRLLADQSQDENQAPGGIGLHNVIKRVSLATAGKGRIAISGGPRQGTVVTIYLPFDGYRS